MTLVWALLSLSATCSLNTQPSAISVVKHQGGDVAQLVEHQVKCAADAGSTPLCSKRVFSQSTCSADSLMVFMQPPYAVTRTNTCVHIRCPQHWQPCIPLFEQTKIQHTLGQPLKMECGCVSGGETEKCHICNLSPEKQGHGFHEKELVGILS